MHLGLRNLYKALIMCVLALVLMGNRGCQTTTVVVPEGPQTTALLAAKDKQIKGLVEQVRAEQEARELEREQASLVAANLDGILFAAEHVDTGLPRTAIEEEAKLGKERSPPPNPTEVARAKDRVIAILQNEVEKAKALYGKAFDEAAQAKATIATKDKEIAKRDETLRSLEGEIAKLNEAAAKEREQSAAALAQTFKDKDAEIKRIKDEYASKERATWILWTRIAGLGFIVLGAVVAIVFKIVREGAAFVGVGVLIGLVSIFIDWVTAQPWFPYVCGFFVLAVVGLGIYALIRAWRKHALHDKVTAAIQDLRDEDTAKGTNAFSEILEPHLKYRLGSKDSTWGRAQAEETIKLGLVDPAGEAALKAAEPKVDKAQSNG